MANNTQITEGVGKIVATDEVAGVNFQRVKLVDGTEDSTTDIAAGGGTEANALRVTIASDSTGVVTVDDGGSALTVDGTVDVGTVANVVHVDDNSGSLTVDGTVSVTGVATESTLSTLNGKVTAVNTGAVVLAAGTAAIGKLAANSGVDIGDVDVLSLPAIPAGTNIIGGIIPNKYPISDDATFVKKFYTYSGAVTDGIVWSPAAGKRWYITDIIVNVSAACTVTFEDDLTAGDSVVMQFEFAANGGMVSNFNTPLFSGEDAVDLLVTTTAGNIYITVTGYEV